VNIPSKFIPKSTAPEYSLKKGFLKREEAIHRAFMRMNNPPKSPSKQFVTKPIPPGSPAVPRRGSKTNSQLTVDRHVKFRPASSVLELRRDKEKITTANRPSSAQSMRSTRKSATPVKPLVKNIKSTTTKSSIDLTKSSLKKKISSDTNKKNSDNPLGDSRGIASNGVRLRQKATRPRPRSMIETKTTSKSIDEFLQIHDLAPVVEQQTLRIERSDSLKSAQSEASSESSVKSRKPRPTSLIIKDNRCVFPNKNRPNAMTPNATSETVRKNTNRSSFQSMESLSVDLDDISETNDSIVERRTRSPRRKTSKPETMKSQDMTTGRFSATRTSSPASRVSTPKQSARLATNAKQTSVTRSQSAGRVKSIQELLVNRSTVSSRRKSTSEGPPGARWNCSTKSLARTPTSPKKTYSESTSKKTDKIKRSLSEQSNKSIRITTEVNKRKNIKFPDGKTVDREVKTTTTVSVDVDSGEDKSNRSNSLLEKVKNLAHEIENLSKDNNRMSDSSSDSIINNSVTVKPKPISESDHDPISEETDHYSETEYLSVFGKN